MPRLFRSSWPPAMLLAAVLLTTSSCGLLGGSSDPSPPGSWGVEKETIRVGRLALVDAVPLHIAMDKGYFAAEGLKVQLSTMARGSDSIDQLISPKPGLDFGLTSYPNALIPQAKGIAKLKIVADAAQTTPDFVVAVVQGGGSITDAHQLAGKKIAISSKRGISELVMDDQLSIMGIDPHSVAFLSMGITDMPAALQRGDIAAAVISQPSLELAKKQGATKLLDPFSGPTADFPWSGWLATEQFVRDNPKTVRAFRRALARGVADAADRNVVEETAVTHLGIDKGIASLMTLPTFPSTEDPKRLQRVADLMAKEGDIPKRQGSSQNERLAELDMTTMILPPLVPEPSSPSAPATTSSK
jgi:NitT/TauT family transport system substrate-binding protein